MLSKNQIKFIKSLKQKKFRLQHQLFVVEGEKIVNDFLNSDWKIEQIYATKEWDGDAVEVSIKELERISSLKTPNKVLAIIKIPKRKSVISGNLVLALDAIKDPGNLGTIIRLADWFGIQHIICFRSFYFTTHYIGINFHNLVVASKEGSILELI